MKTIQALVAAASLIGIAQPSLGASRLNGEVREYSSYFTTPRRWRHHRLELQVKQTTEFSPAFKTVISGRTRYDLALRNFPVTPNWDFDDAVIEDELFEAEAREVYFDYMTDAFALRVGQQFVDWVDGLSLLSSDMMTAIDLRHGGFGDSAEVILPQTGVKLNHGLLLDIKAEWLVIFRPRMNRAPEGANGYGLYESLEDRRRADQLIVLREEPLPDDDRAVEGGVRLSRTLAEVDVTLMAYRGFQKDASFRVIPATRGVIIAESYHEKINTYGIFLGKAADAWATRVFAMAQPRRMPLESRYSDPAASNYDQKTRYGFGFDLVFSQHLKIYTESLYTHLQRYRDFPPVGARSFEDEFTFSYKLVNNTWEKFTLSLEGVATGPEASYLWHPFVQWTMTPEYQLTLGGRYIKSLSDQAQLDMLRNSSHAYLSLSRFFGVDSTD